MLKNLETCLCFDLGVWTVVADHTVFEAIVRLNYHMSKGCHLYSGIAIDLFYLTVPLIGPGYKGILLWYWIKFLY